jgi:hypothetical protein
MLSAAYGQENDQPNSLAAPFLSCMLIEYDCNIVAPAPFVRSIYKLRRSLPH